MGRALSVLLVLLAGCGGGKRRVDANATDDACGRCEPGPYAAVANPAIDEASGIVASAVHDGVVYVHNDSGDSARFFAVGPNGEDLGELRLEGVTAIDFEDAARGPCGGESCLYFADIGNNATARDTYAIHRVVEPATLGGVQTLAAETFAFHYPDGSHDAEALLVHPVTGEIAVVVKADPEPAGIYAFPSPLVSGGALVLVGTVLVPMGVRAVTAGDVAPDGSAVLLRTYTDVWWFEAPAPNASLAATLATVPCAAPVAGLEIQGEAIAFRADGRGFWTIAEGGLPTVNGVVCGP